MARPHRQNHRTVWRKNPRRKLVDLDRAFAVVHDDVRRATLDVHERLMALGVPHVLVGGLAVGAHGYPYATHDVDFVVGDEAFDVTGNGLVTFASGVPIEAHGVTVDYLSPDPVARLDQIVESTRGVADLLIVPLEQLFYMKLRANRPKDRAALVGLVHAGVEIETVRDFIREVAPDLLPRLDRVLRDAEESDG